MEAFELHGHDGSPLPCLLHGDAVRSALVLPGAGSAGNRLGGTPARPDLHYTRALLLEHGLSVLEVWWDVDTADRDDLAGWLLANARAATDEIRGRGHELVLLAGRSLGTLALALLRTEPEYARLPSIWIAPLLHREPVRASLLADGRDCFLVCGAEDEAYDEPVATLLRKRGTNVVVLERADHGLDCGDAPTSARALAGALAQMRDFLGAAC